MSGPALSDSIVPHPTMGSDSLHHLRSSHVSAVIRHLKGRKMFEDDRSYYQRRAEIELKRARESTVHNVVQAHHQLAQAYLEKMASAEPVSADAA